MNELGIMQGRLSPPRLGRIQSFPAETWEAEFDRARDCGFSFIEWVFDLDGAAENPLLIDKGIARIRARQQDTGVRVGAVCADYFRDRPLIRVDQAGLTDRLAVLRRLAGSCRRLGIPSIMIPFVDGAAINNAHEIEEAVLVLRSCSQMVDEHGLYLSLETNLAPDLYRQLLEGVDQRALKVNYDMGDCASLGHDLVEEIQLLRDWIIGIHVKDRKQGGSTVPLGSGDVNFPAVFAALDSTGYRGPITLQAARGGDEVALATENLAFVRSQLEAAARLNGR